MSIFRPSRRWLRFSLRTFLVSVSLVCIGVAWYINGARRQMETVQAVQDYGGWVYYDFMFNDAKPPKKVRFESPWPSWLIETFGIDMFHNVVEVNLVYRYSGGKRVETRNTSDEIIPRLGAFPNLRRLFLRSSQVTDATMPHIARLRKLEEFFVWEATRLSDEGIKHLRSLDSLWSIHISNSQIGDESLRVFAQLPRIQYLSLQGNYFSDRGLKYLRNMKQLKSVWIGLGHREITDAGAEQFLNLKNLEELDLQRYPISREMQQRLKRLPTLKRLHWNPPLGFNYVNLLPSHVGYHRATTATRIISARNENRGQSNARRPQPLRFPIYGLQE